MYPAVITLGWSKIITWALKARATDGGSSKGPPTSPLRMSVWDMPRQLNPILSPGTACGTSAWCISTDLTSPSFPPECADGLKISLVPALIVPDSTRPTGTAPIPEIL